VLEHACLVRKVGSFETPEKIDETVTTTESYTKTLAKIVKKYPRAKISPVAIYQADNTASRNITFHIEVDKK